MSYHEQKGFESPETPESLQTRVLEHLNNNLHLLGDPAQWMRLPEYLPDYEPLKTKRIIMLDDGKLLIASYLPYLEVATQGNAGFVHHKGENPSDTASQILAQNPDIVLLDYKLAGNITGTQVANTLKERAYSGVPIGFSSSPDFLTEFQRHGVELIVEKSGDPEYELGKIAQIVKKLDQETES